MPIGFAHTRRSWWRWHPTCWSAMGRSRSQQCGTQPAPSQLFLSWSMIPSDRALSRAWRVRAATSPVLPFLNIPWLESRWRSSGSLRQAPIALPSCLIPRRRLTILFSCVRLRPSRPRAPVGTEADIKRAVAKLAGEPGSGLLVPPDTFTVVHRDLIISSAAQHRVPAIFTYRQFVREGALVAYGPDTTDIFQRSASYVDRILRGANPGDLPVQAPNKFELAINVKTARRLGLELPPTLLGLADEIIE